VESIQRRAVINNYISIEKQLMDFLAVVPLEPQHLNVWSPQLVSLILDTSSQIDSLLRYYTVKKEGNLYIEHAKNNVNIVKHFKRHGEMLSKQWVVCWGSDGYLIQPFKEWSGNDEYAPLFWWDAYNKIKHDRISNMNKGTLHVAMNCVSALFLAIINSLALRNELEASGYFVGDHCSHDVWLTCPELDETSKYYATIETKMFSHPLDWCDKKVDYSSEWEGDSSLKFKDWFRGYNTHLSTSRRELA
jgi:hypothetical protein